MSLPSPGLPTDTLWLQVVAIARSRSGNLLPLLLCIPLLHTLNIFYPWPGRLTLNTLPPAALAVSLMSGNPLLANTSLRIPDMYASYAASPGLLMLVTSPRELNTAIVLSRSGKRQPALIATLITSNTASLLLPGHPMRTLLLRVASIILFKSGMLWMARLPALTMNIQALSIRSPGPPMASLWLQLDRILTSSSGLPQTGALYLLTLVTPLLSKPLRGLLMDNSSPPLATTKFYRSGPLSLANILLPILTMLHGYAPSPGLPIASGSLPPAMPLSICGPGNLLLTSLAASFFTEDSYKQNEA